MKTLSMIFLVCCLSVGFEPSAAANMAQPAPGNCTITIKGTFNGTEVDVQITVSDVSWLECAALKLGVKKALQ